MESGEEGVTRVEGEVIRGACQGIYLLTLGENDHLRVAEDTPVARRDAGTGQLWRPVAPRKVRACSRGGGAGTQLVRSYERLFAIVIPPL